jgi:hypothetical protein
MRKLQDVLRKHILREALEPVATVELEKPIALLDEQRADGYCELRPDRPPESALPHLGLLRRIAELSWRSFIEQYSKTVSTDDLDDALRKVALFYYGLKKAAKRRSVQKPVLCIVSPGRPKKVLVDYVGLPAPGWPPGVYRCAPGLALWVVVLSELPKTAETRALRMFGKPAMQLEVLRELNALPLDDPQNEPWVDILADVRYLIEQVPDLSPEEQTIMTELRQRWEREKAELRSSAQVETKAEAILAVLATRGFKVSEAVRRRILGCRDQRVLDRWLARAVTASSDSDVIAA